MVVRLCLVCREMGAAPSLQRKGRCFAAGDGGDEAAEEELDAVEVGIKLRDDERRE